MEERKMKSSIFFVQSSVILVLSLVLTCAASATDPNIDPNLVGWWKFDEGSGTIAIDSSGHECNGTIYGGPTWQTSGSPVGNSGYLKFNGSNNCVVVNCTRRGAFLLSQYTIAMWFRVDGGSAYRDLLSAFDANLNHGFLLELRDTNVLRCLHRHPFRDNGGEDIYTTTTYNDGLWHHVAAVRASDNSRLLYVDGQQVGSDPNSTTAFDAPLKLILGALRPNERGWNGAIDDVRIYNRPLTQAEIKQIVTSSTAWKPSSPDKQGKP
jgi:hypothetical protein